MGQWETQTVPMTPPPTAEQTMRITAMQFATQLTEKGHGQRAIEMAKKIDKWLTTGEEDTPS